mgnify:CR=1 FL=1
MDFRGAPAELDDGHICFKEFVSEAHARVVGNILVCLYSHPRRSEWRPYNSLLAVRTGECSIRNPDVSVYCRKAPPEDRHTQLLGDPRVVVEVLSPSTASYDQKVKLDEYRALAGVQDILLVDLARERVRLVTRTAPEEWTDRWLERGADVPVPSLGLVLPHAEIFAED